MTEQPRDWDKELADIDRAIAKQPGAPPTTGQGGPPMSLSRRRFVALAWFWTSLAIVLGVALLVWPYDKFCGLRLIFYLGAVFITLLMSFLGALASWSGRQGLAFLLSLIVMVFAGVMAMREILPRAGYAREARDWTCSSSPPASSPATPSTGQPGT
jgi:hypothetical protein